MSGWPAPVAKVSALQQLDKLSKDPATLTAVLAELRTPNSSLIAIGLKYGVLTQEEANFVEQGWFQRWSTAEARIREGLIKAFDLALNKQVAISSYWIAPGFIQEVHVEAFFYDEPPEPGVEEKDRYSPVINLNIYTPWPGP
jgi:hypothetical protein